jgi:hypothetical protein
MRIAAMGLVGALALVATAANAAPSVPAPAGEHNIVAVAGGCGWGLHPNRWGDCVPNRYGYRRTIGIGTGSMAAATATSPGTGHPRPITSPTS